MKIFLAGGVQGNLKPFWKRVCEFVLNGDEFQKACDKSIEIFLAGENGKSKIIREVHGEGVSCKPSHAPKIQERVSNVHEPIRGGGLSVNENIPCRDSIKTVDTQTDIHGRWGIFSEIENEDISSRKCDIPDLYRSDAIRGGFSIDEDIPSWSNTVCRSERNRGGFDKAIKEWKPYILESFYYADSDTERLLPYYGDFLLDSGAFTFVQGKGSIVDWDSYIQRYGEFIKRNGIKKYFELDIDSVVGYEQVKKYRKKLEKIVGYQCIPVWHKSRGIEEYKLHCQEYPYVAIGGYVIKELTPKDYSAFPAMIKYAHQNNAKVHCLGFTKLDALPKYHFDSVDSTAWTTGNRFGFLYYFDGKTMRKKEAPKGHRIIDSRAAALNNYVEWIKFQKYANIKL